MQIFTRRRFLLSESKILIFTLLAIPVYFINNIFKFHCFTGTDSFGCPRYGVPAQFKEKNILQEENYLKNYTCPVLGTDLIIVKTRQNEFRLHEETFEFYSKRGFQVRFLIGDSRKNSRLISNFERYIIGDYEDRYENLHFKTFSAFQFISACSLRNSNIIFLDDDTFFDPMSKIQPSPITCGHARNDAELTWKKPFGKYRLSNDVWPDNYRYPTYCAGACTVLTSSAAHKIYNIAKKIKLTDFNIDDVLFTGVYRELADIPVPSVDKKLSHHFVGDYDALIKKYETYWMKIK